MKLDPRERLTAKQCLQHKFLRTADGDEEVLTGEYTQADRDEDSEEERDCDETMEETGEEDDEVELVETS
jgi:hypothetical protein